jgi:hypothetical protein
VVAHAVFRTPDDGRKEHPKHAEKSCSEIKYRLLTAASCWKLIYIRLVMHGTMNLEHYHYSLRKNTEERSSLLATVCAELNPICHFLALLGAHHILHVSRLRVILQRGKHDTVLEFLVKIWQTEYSIQKKKDLGRAITTDETTNQYKTSPRKLRKKST